MEMGYPIRSIAHVNTSSNSGIALAVRSGDHASSGIRRLIFSSIVFTYRTSATLGVLTSTDASRTRILDRFHFDGGATILRASARILPGGPLT